MGTNQSLGDANGPPLRGIENERKVTEMESERSCGFLSGPQNTSLKIAPSKWWLAISRDVLAKGYRRHICRNRPPVACHRTPTFSSPLENRSS